MSAANALLSAARADGYSFAMLTNEEGREVIRVTPVPPKQLEDRLRMHRDEIAAVLRAEVSPPTDLRNSAQLGNGQTEPMSNIKTSLEFISPARAAELLAKNHNNRPIQPTLVKRIARDITEGRWQVNGQTIIVSSTGELLDGQHRLSAIIQAGKGVNAMVSTGVPGHYFATIDSGRSRNVSDVLSVMGVRQHKEVAAALGVLEPWMTGVLRDYNRSQTTIEESYNKYPGLQELCVHVSNQAKRYAVRLRVSILTAAVYRFGMIDKDAANKFLIDVLSGANLDEGDPVLALRRRMQNDLETRGTTADKWVYLSRFIAAWNARCQGKKIAHIKQWVPGSTDFPVVMSPRAVMA